ncbi:MAG: fibrobacter succinogenes major paralogous domain-containing protein, partial [Flavobacteriaceae bacterium]|nr:fibrobacter succinogenes major paralogous domain-containing protein [Flavobacteriaceae bacterium]
NPAFKGTNDPCPTGYRVPTKSEWDGIFRGVGGLSIDGSDPFSTTSNEINKWEYVVTGGGTAGWLVYPPKVDADKNITGYFDIPTLFLPAAGLRAAIPTGSRVNNWIYDNLGSLHHVGVRGYYWTSETMQNGIREIATYPYYENVNSDLSYALCIGGYTTYFKADIVMAPRAMGFNVRCIKEH